MKQLLIVLCALGLGVAAHGQTNMPAAADAPNAAVPPHLPEPLSATTPDNTRYLNDPNLLAGCQADLTAFDNKPCDLIFIGDSITAGWRGAGKTLWDQMYAPRHALNFGISGDRTQNVIWRLNNMDVQNLKPKVAVVLIGGNNTANSTHEIADGIKAVLFNAQVAFPGVKIILVSIIPNEREHDKMMQVDSIIKIFADDSSVYFLNLVPLMPAVTTTNADGTIDTTYKGIGPDHIHPDATGYQIWAGAMEPLLAKLLAGGN
jgi:lysophospholipase L1-like esterase